MNAVRLLVALALCGVSGAEVFAQSATIENLSYLNFNTRFATANGVSPDGQTVTGQSGFSNSPNRTHAFRWTPSDKLQNLGAFSPPTESANASGEAVSANGWIVGSTTISTSDSAAFRLGAFGGMQGLPRLGVVAGAQAVSDDASVIVGYSYSGSRYVPVRWIGANNLTIDPLRTIGDVVGSAFATAVSADGSTIAGYSWNGANNHACLYRIGQPAFDLGSLAGPAGASVVNGLSADGALAVGYSQNPAGYYRAAYWRAGDGLVELRTVDGVSTGSSIANDTSGDGRVIVGNSSNASRPGGSAAVWINGQPRQLWDLLVTDYRADLTHWTSLDDVTDVSRDGSVLVGRGVYHGASSAFRITLRPNSPPSVAPPTPARVESTGSATRIVLTAKANDPDATDRLTVNWGIGGSVLQSTGNLVPGSDVTFSYNYKIGATPVWVQVSDGKAPLTGSSTTVSVVDTKSPIVVVANDVRVKVNRGEVFASGVSLGRPAVVDVCDPKPKVTNNARKKYPIGTTNVTWTVRDKSGNVARAVQKVIVKNDPPVANAGANVTQSTTASSVNVRLNGSLSRDPNGHTLKYLWKAPGAKLSSATAVRPMGTFPVGTTRVTLTVTDEGKLKSTDVMIVKIQAAKATRTAAKLADASVREAQVNAVDSIQRGKGDASSAQGLSYAASAYAIGALAGDKIGADKQAAASADELNDYLVLRAQAAQQARMAGNSFYQSYLVSGDGNSLAASMYAYYGSAYGVADLSSNDVHEELVEGQQEARPFGQP